MIPSLFPAPRAAVPLLEVLTGPQVGRTRRCDVLGPFRKVVREEPDSRGPEASSLDEREVPAAAGDCECGRKLRERRGRGRSHRPRSTQDTAWRKRDWLGPLSGPRSCQ